MKILITHEYSGRVRDAFAKKGHDTLSCDLLPTENPGNHYQGDLFDIVDGDFDFIGSHPECTYLTNSGVRWLYNKDGSKNIDRWIKLENAVNHFNQVKSKIKTGYLENPIPHKYARDGFKSVVTGKWVKGIGNYDQVVQPWQFGHKELKATCLWLIGLPKLIPSEIINPPSDKEERKKWAIVHRCPPGADRWKIRSRTYMGIAKAMAYQWSNYLTPLPNKEEENKKK